MAPFNFDNTPITSDLVLVPLFTPSTTTYCPADSGFEATLSGQTASKSCASGKGTVTRVCTKNGWDIADESACTSSNIPTNYLIYGGISIGALLLLLILL